MLGESETFIWRSSLGSAMHFVQTVSETPYSLKFVCLKTASSVERWQKRARTEEPMGSRQFPATSSGSNGGHILCMNPSNANRYTVFIPEFNILHKYLQIFRYLCACTLYFKIMDYYIFPKYSILILLHTNTLCWLAY